MKLMLMLIPQYLGPLGYSSLGYTSVRTVRSQNENLIIVLFIFFIHRRHNVIATVLIIAIIFSPILLVSILILVITITIVAGVPLPVTSPLRP